MENNPNWESKGEAITRTFVFKDFADAMLFVNKVAIIAEKHQHHPDIDIRWNKVTLLLMTHDENKVTEKDFLVANDIDQLS